MFLDTAARVGEEIVMLKLNDGHANTVVLLPGVGVLVAASVANPPQLCDLFSVFRGEQVGKYQQAACQSWHHQCLAGSEKKKLETFFLIIPIPDVTIGLRSNSQTG